MSVCIKYFFCVSVCVHLRVTQYSCVSLFFNGLCVFLLSVNFVDVHGVCV